MTAPLHSSCQQTTGEPQQHSLLRGRRIWVAGHRGMVGRALMRRLEREECQLLTVDRHALDLRRQQDVEGWVRENRPEFVFVAAATVGGILANSTRPADFLYDNLAMATNVLEASRRHGVTKLLFLGSSCIYPRLAAQPIREEALLTGPLEPTNEWYAVAKIAGIKMCEAYRQQYGCDFISAMPTNLYGPGDNYDLESSHVLPALIHKVHRAKQQGQAHVKLWGTGTPRREFLYVHDCAEALVLLMERYSESMHVNIGTGTDVSISELAEIVAEAIGYSGSFVFDTSRPDGTPRKLLDISRARACGWEPAVSLRDGIRRTYDAFVNEFAAGALREKVAT